VQGLLAKDRPERDGIVKSENGTDDEANCFIERMLAELRVALDLSTHNIGWYYAFKGAQFAVDALHDSGIPYEQMRMDQKWHMIVWHQVETPFFNRVNLQISQGSGGELVTKTEPFTSIVQIPDGYDLSKANEDLLRIARDSQLAVLAKIEAWADDPAFAEVIERVSAR
jgi:hypothetical protein